MKIRIEIDDSISETEVVIRCRELDGNTAKIQQAVSDLSQTANITFYKNHVEYYLPLEKVLFFETGESVINAHTANDIFTIKNKLYELENILPNSFVRVSKSTILNIKHIYSIERNLTSASIVQFSGTHKQVYVSRSYYKSLKQRLDERR